MSRFSSLTSKVFTLTPKVLANLSPGLERSDNPGIGNKYFLLTLKGFLTRQTLSGFIPSLYLFPRVVAVLQPRAGISERLRRFI